MRGRHLVGIGILLVVVLGVVAYNLIESGTLNPPVLLEPVTLKGFVGGEKVSFLEDAKVRAILKKRYRIDLEVIKAGSLEIAQANPQGADFLWPGTEVALDLYRAQNRPLGKEQSIFHSPLVLYSWDSVVRGLERQGYSRKVDDAYYTVDLVPLVGAVATGTTWREIGLPELYGKMKITSADPKRSSSGLQFASLLAAGFSGGEIADETTVELLLPKIKAVFSGMGTLQGDGDELYARYLRQGAGAYPIIAGYENQVIEFAAANRQDTTFLKDKTRVLYPQPTVWSSHPLIVVEPKAERLIQALMDAEVQQIAWTRHGFRGGVGPAKDDQGVLQALGVAPTVDKVVPMPRSAVVQRIVAAASP